MLPRKLMVDSAANFEQIIDSSFMETLAASSAGNNRDTNAKKVFVCTA